MEAEVSRARRPVHPVVVRSHFWRLRMPLSALLVALVLGVAGLAPAAATPERPATQPTAATEPAPDAVSIDVAPKESAIVRPGEPLAVTVRITNTTTEQVDAGTLKLYLATRALISRSALENWLRPEKVGDPGDLLVSGPSRVIRPGGTATFDLTVPAKSVGLSEANAWGARGIAATLTADEEVLAQGRGTFTWHTDADITPVELAIAMPITTPPGSQGLIPAEELAAYTDPTGTLSRQLDGVMNRPVAIAIDPMIIASIRILGSSAPPSATGWLDRLSEATNDIFPLSYADADISLQAQAGSKTVLAPISFDWLIDPELFLEPPVGPESTPSPVTATPGTASPSPGPTVSPSPSPTPGPVVPPSSAGLLDWDYTMTNIGWPADGVVAKADLDVFTASGLTTTILDGENVSAPDDDHTPNAVVPLGNGRALATDNPISSALQAAALAQTDDEWRGAMAEVSSQVAAVSAEEPGTTRTLLATFDRGWPDTPNRLGQTLDALAALPWQSPATLGEAISAVPATDVGFKPLAATAVRLGVARVLLEQEASISTFSTALADPVVVTGAHRLDLLALLATSWAEDRSGWQEAVGVHLVASGEILRSVTVTTKGPINVVGSKVDVPVTLNNSLDQAVTVRMRVVPSNGRLVVGEEVEATINANSARTVKVPVTAAVGNGEVTLRVSLFTPTGARMDQPAQIAVNVRADWEGVGALIFAIAVVLFFGFGVWRNILRRRRERAHIDTDDGQAAVVGTGETPVVGTGETPVEPADGPPAGPPAGHGSGKGPTTDDITEPAADPRV